MRRFGSGRVDNIRANTQEALEWVTAMMNKALSKERKLELFRKAVQKQAQVTVEVGKQGQLGKFQWISFRTSVGTELTITSARSSASPVNEKKPLEKTSRPCSWIRCGPKS